MTETNAQEPTMEEILASIRRIISEDDTPAPEIASAPEVSAPSPVAAAPPAPVAPPAEEDVLELTDPVEPVAAAPPKLEPLILPPPKPEKSEKATGDPDVFATTERPAPAPAYPAQEPYASSFSEEPLVGSYAAEATAGHFGSLARSISMPKEGRSLEDLVREMLRPMLRDWLDQHLPAIVEARVQAEVERIARRQDY